MQRYTITKGATSQIILVSVYDSSSSTGGKLTGLVYNSAGLTAYYYREGAGTGATAITLATATLGTYTSGGFIAIDGTNMPGDYELHLPTAVLASGADRVLIQLKGATNMVPVNIEIDLVDFDLRTSMAGLVDLNWDEPAAGHLTAGTTGLSETLGSAALIDSSITGTPTTTTFDFTGGSTSANFYADQLVYILSGTGVGQVRPIISSSYSGGTTTITVDEAFVVTPAASDRFAILVSHVHPKTQIATQVMTSLDASGSTVIDAILADTAEIGVAGAGLTNINLPDQTMNITGNITGNLSGSVGSVTGHTPQTADHTANIAAILTDTGTTIPDLIAALNDPSVADILTTAMTEAYATAGAAPTLAQILFEIRALMAEKTIASTTLTAKKLDGSTTAATYTLDDATSPTSITRTT